MNDRPDMDPLLQDVLAEATPPEFRAVLLRETLREARRRRIRRRVGRTAVVAAMVSVLGIFLWRNPPSPGPELPAPVIAYERVTTQPLPGAATISTRSLAADELVASVSATALVRTTSVSGEYRVIGDDELLALAPGPAVLVRVGPQSQRLIFVDPAEPATLPWN